jgi:recombinational DNA repair protein RecR
LSKHRELLEQLIQDRRALGGFGSGHNTAMQTLQQLQEQAAQLTDRLEKVKVSFIESQLTALCIVTSRNTCTIATHKKI